jgi:GMP reductase
MRLHDGIKLGFNDVLITPKRSTVTSRQDVELVRTFKTARGSQIKGVPIIASNMATGNLAMLHALSQRDCFTAIAKHHYEDWLNKDNIYQGVLDWGFYTLGMSTEDFDHLMQVRQFLLSLNENLDGKPVVQHLKICIDVANGYSKKFVEMVQRVRYVFDTNVIMAGNVCTTDMTQELILNGVDIVKIGIGAGSECLTTLKTGVGYPQLSAAIENADCAHGLGALICLDGGIRSPGDIAKAFCANADFVMIGGMLAGTNECEGDVVDQYRHDGTWDLLLDGFVPNVEEKHYKLFYGSSSKYAQDKHGGGFKSYRASEGRDDLIECKGSATSVIDDILGGLRSCGTYIGADKLKNFGKCGSFIRVTNG